MSWSIVQADCLDFLRSQPDDSIDLVFGSPPYEQARLYLEGGEDLGVSRKTREWAIWMANVHEAAQKTCKGLVAFVVAGQTKNYRWSAGPVLYMANLHALGMNLRNPPIFARVGIPGSGGPDWLRGDYEWIVCTTRPGKLPWSDNTAAGHPPKWAPGGEMSNRLSNGQRVNQWGKTGTESVNGHAARNADGQRQKATRPSHKMRTKGGSPKDGCATQPAIANPGNIIQINVGGGVMGHELAHENEAPFPLKLAELFVQSFAPPGGIVCDPFSGSGTTAHAAVLNGRNFSGCDLRQSQVDLAHRRMLGITPDMFA